MPQFPSQISSSGIWTLRKQSRAAQGLNWPPLNRIDPLFDQVALLLHGDGTNGAQNNTFLDSSTNNFSITRNGNATQGTFTPFGDNWSNYFDGSDSLSFPAGQPWNFGTGPFTIETWVFPDGDEDNEYGIFGVNGDSQNEWYFGVGAGLNNWGIFFYWGNHGSNQTERYTQVYPQKGVWSHVAVTRDSNSTWRFFLNGVALASYTYGEGGQSWSDSRNLNNTSLPATIGSGLKGYHSNLRVLKQALYTANFTPPSAPLTAIANTSLLTCQSRRFIDNGPNALAPTRNGDVAVRRFSPFNPTNGYQVATIGGSGYFDGNGDYLTAAQNAAFNFGTGAFTVEAWIYITANNGTNQRIVGLGDGAVGGGPFSGWALNIISSLSAISWYRYDGTETSLSASYSFSLNTWYHIVAVRNGSSNLSIYVNGTRVYNNTGASLSYNNVNSNPLYFGAGYDGAGGSPSWKYFNGYISNARIVAGTAVYDPSLTTLTVPTVPLTAVSGTSLLLNFTNAGFVDNAMLYDLETVGGVQISTAQSKFGSGSMQFNGSNSIIPLPYNEKLNFGTSNFTIEMWLNPSTTNHQSACLFTQEHISANNTPISICLFLNGGNYEAVGNGIGYGVYGGAAGGGNWVFVKHNRANIPVGTWTHVALVRNGNTFTVYVNGTAVDSTVSGTSCSLGSTQYFIGRRWDTYGSYPYYNGYMDDFRITLGVARYVSNFTPPELPFPDQ